MYSSFSVKDEIWFLRMCRCVSKAVYELRLLQSCAVKTIDCNVAAVDRTSCWFRCFQYPLPPIPTCIAVISEEHPRVPSHLTVKTNSVHGPLRLGVHKITVNIFFTFMWPCIVTNFFLIKPTRCTEFTNLFCHEALHISDSSSVHHQEFIYCTLSNGICRTSL